MKRLLQSVITILLALFLIAGMIPAEAKAVEITTDNTTEYEVADTQDDLATKYMHYGNDAATSEEEPFTPNMPAPKYDGTIGFEGLSVIESDESALSVLSVDSEQVDFAAEQELEAPSLTAEDAIIYIRQEMVARSTAIRFKLESLPEESLDIAVNELVEQALAHTGMPDEGDSLRWCIRYSSVTFPEDVITIYLQYYTTAQEESMLNAEINRVLTDIGISNMSSDYDKLCAIYNYITENVEYDYEHLNDEDYFSQYTAFAALCHKTAVCQGYSLLLYRMLLTAGVDCRCVPGQSFNQNHMWNTIELNGKWYMVDATWDSGNWKYNYFLNSFSDHIVESWFELPAPRATSDYPTVSAVMTEGDFEYKVLANRCVITCYTGQGGDIVVPSQINNLPVIALDSLAINAPVAEHNSLTISEGIRYLADQAICGSELHELHLPSSLALNLPKTEGAICGISQIDLAWTLEIITVPEESPYLKVVDNVLFDKDMTCLFLYPAGSLREEYTVPDGVRIIGDSAGQGAVNLKTIHLPDSILQIGYWAFPESGLTGTFVIPPRCSLVGQYAFSGTKITSFIISENTHKFMTGRSCYLYLERFEVSPDNPCYCDIDGALYSKKDGQPLQLLVLPSAKTGNYTIPDGVTGMDDSALHQLSISRLTVPQSMNINNWNTELYPCLNTTLLVYEGSPAEKSAKEKGLSCFLIGKATVEILYERESKGFSWTITSTGVLTITGTGTIPYEPEDQEWRKYSDTINALVLDEGITDIPGLCFSCLPVLSSIVFPSTLKQIGVGAFCECTSLRTVILPEGLETVESLAFDGCNLQDLYISSTVTEIAVQAFSPLQNAQRLEFTVAENNPCFSADKNMLFNKDRTKLIQASNGLGKYFTVPDSVKEIGPYAFYQVDVKGLTFGSELEILDDFALYGMNICYVDTIVFPSSLRKVGCDACYLNGFSTGTEPFRFSGQAPEFDENAFAGLKKIIIGYPLHEPSWESVITNSFGGNQRWEAYEIQAETILYQGTYQGFSWSLTDAGTLSISGQGTLPAVTESSLQWQAYKDQVKSLILSEGITHIPYSSFNDYNMLAKVQLPSTLKSIEDLAFWGCNQLDFITLPDGIESIGEYAFIYTCITEFHLPASLKDITANSLYTGNAQEFFVSENNPYYSADRDMLFNKDRTKLIRASDMFTKFITIPDSVKEICPYAFYQVIVEGLLLGSGLEKLDDYAFYGMDVCFSDPIILPPSLKSVGRNVFRPGSFSSYDFSIRFTGIAPDFAEQTLHDFQGVTIHYPLYHYGWEDVIAKAIKDSMPWIGYQKGDINHDKAVNLKDVSLLYSDIMNMYVFDSFMYDITADSKVDLKDVAALFRQCYQGQLSLS